MAQVLVSVPNGDGWLHKTVVFAVLRLLTDSRHQVRVIMPTHKPSENNYHHILRDFMAGDFEYWLNIDADNPPTKNPLDLIDLDLEIIGCPTPVWCNDRPGQGQRPFYWNAYKAAPGGWTEWPDKIGLQEVDAVGFGCVLFARRVFTDHPELRVSPFRRTLYPDGRVEKGTDLAFCERATTAGVGIWAHFDYPCDHMVELPMIEMMKAMVPNG